LFSSTSPSVPFKARITQTRVVGRSEKANHNGEGKGARRLFELCVLNRLTVGFDNISAAAYAMPGLTTVNQDHFEKGCAAARLLTEQIRGTGTTTCILESPVVKASLWAAAFLGGRGHR